MTARKIEAMHLLYGTGEGVCDDCPFFYEVWYRDRHYFKCSVYGMTHSEATDWRRKYAACGLKHKESRPDERPVIDRLKGQRINTGEVQIEGQISLEEVLNEHYVCG